MAEGTDLLAADAGPDGGAAGAEEAAVHLTDEDAELDDADGSESLADAIGFTARDDLRDTDPDAGDDYR
ncbi:DUF5709 domain-containing protein [Kitasatospora saccharophila]|uniref:DUF5709 domain-containing protein n=1 Tax=Kitasatospora saccharophila TaxID=407973 RepID=UPI00362F07C0